ncbi:MAG: type VI secretion system protein TssA [Alphaproteobacteria bacterium]|nr:type VI secretion system protein TssA [Alphaproteobacteria bacterium]MBV8410757.1 type VI secretion system protein TssA [Alphaproteobacteria bacterium]
MAADLESIDLEAILAPIPGERATGTDLREDYSPSSVYFRLRDARADARDAERKSDSPEEGVDTGAGLVEALQAKWQPVANLAIQALTETTKDLEVATWLTEALVRIAGMPGLAAGAAIIGGLSTRYWDELFPMPEDGDLEPRLGAVAGLSGQGVDGTLMQPLRKTTLFMRPNSSPFTLSHYQLTEELAKTSNEDQRAQLTRAGALPFDDFEKEGRSVGSAHWEGLRETVIPTLAAWEEMDRALNEKVGNDSPSMRNVKKLLELVLEVCDRFAPPGQAVSEAVPAQPTTPGATAAPVAAAGAAPGVITGREEALRQLAAIAEWFKRNEPNSPIGFTLDEAVRRGRLAWPDLAAELIADETSRSALFISVGMKRPETPQ